MNVSIGNFHYLCMQLCLLYGKFVVRFRGSKL